MNKLIAAVPDSLAVAGGCLLSYGCGLLHPAAGFIVGGLLMIGFGALAARKVAE